MATVYGNALLNLVALGPSGQGCFTYRNPLARRPCRLLENGGNNILAQRPRYDPRYQGNTIEIAPLLWRAWVFQERVLSRRNLFFGALGIYWECCQEELSEFWPYEREIYRDIEEIPLKLSFHIVLPHSRIEGNWPLFASVWRKVVTEYSKTNLSFEKDRMIALSGIANAVTQSSGMHYLAGLWKELLPMGLLWRLYHPKYKGTQLHRAPSWSWQSIDRRVEYFYVKDFERLKNIYVAKVIDCRVTSVQDGDADLGSTTGVLKIQGYLQKTAGRLHPHGDENGSMGLKAVLLGHKKDRTFIPDIMIDRSTELFFLLISLDILPGISPRREMFLERGLVLVQSRYPDKNTFFRVGSFLHEYTEGDRDVIYDGGAEQLITIC